MPRFFHLAPIPLDQIHVLPEHIARHIRVLRLRVGDIMTLFDGEGGEIPATITSIDKRQISVKTAHRQPIERESELNLHLVQAISSGDRMDYTLQKAVELGVRSIWPVHSERSAHIAPERQSRKYEHWQGIIVSACEQCGRNTIPTLHPIQNLADFPQPATSTQRFILSPHGKERLRTLPRPHGEIWILAGAEGGLTHGEEHHMCALGWQALKLGARILRTETAALAACAAMHALWGDF